MPARNFVMIAVALLALAGCVREPQYETTIDQWSDLRIFSGEEPVSPIAEPASQSGWTASVVAPATVIGSIVEPFHSPKAVADSDPPYLLDAGDKLRIFVYGQPNLTRIYQVDGAGFISVPLIGQVKARGLTTYDVERAIRGRLASTYVKDPQVSVDIAVTRPFFVLGEVRTAGQYPYVPGMTALNAVAIAGGYSDRAYERKVQITRRINGIIEKMEVPADTIVLPGDTIYVRERWF